MSIWKSASDGSYIWLQVRSSIGLLKDLYICTAYLSPETSTFYHNPDVQEPFDMLLQDIAALQSLNGSVLLAGDFNARTATLPDFIPCADHAELLPPDLPISEALPADILPRCSADQGVPNHFGHKLLALCQDSNMLILNGRAAGDQHGGLTCHTPNGASTVDYFVASPSVFALKPSLHVQVQPPDSDHCPLLLQIPITEPTPCPPSPTPPHVNHKPVKIRHVPDRVEQYRSVLADALHFHFEPHASVHTQCFATAMQECIISAASQSHGYCKPSPKQHTPPAQPWYDDECIAIRKRLNALAREDPCYNELCKEYTRVKRRKRRQAQIASQKHLCEQAYHDAHAFWRRYRKRDKVLSNVSTQQWFSAFKELFGPDMGLASSLEQQGETPGEAGLASSTEEQGQPPGESTELNECVTSEEVTAAFKRLKRHKAAGIDGIKAEFLLDAEDILTEPLAKTFSQMLSTGVPQTWCSGVIHPIFKSGDADDPSNYRGITVTSVLAKVFAMILEARMTAWAEGRNLRAQGQAGFRSDHRTVDNVFIMRTLIANARRSRKKLYCCFVDFKKAFDSVPRDSLWQVLADMGVTGDILECLKSIYDKDEACVLTGEGLTDSFRCTIGVKQGCPASPLLFGLYIDKIEQLLRDAKDDIDAPMLLQCVVAILLFADDIALFSYTHHGLQSQLNILQSFCDKRGLTVNVKKTKVVVFEGKQSQSPTFTYAGAEIEQVEEFKYLGICFHATRGLSCAIEYLCNSARKAMFAVLGRCHELHIQQPLLKLKLFDALVRPIMTYACEAWAIMGAKGLLYDMEKIELRFLKMLLGVPQNTSSKLVYAEFGRLPLPHFWLQQSLKYLGRMLSLDDDRLCKVAFLADSQAQPGWYHGLKDQLRYFGIRLPRTLQDVNCKELVSALKDQAIVANMTATENNHLELAYFSHKVHFRCEPYIAQSKNKHLRKAVAMFRTGTHWLSVRSGRLQGLEYSHRMCPCCNLLDDEMHAIFHCRIYDQQRSKFLDLFSQAPDLIAFLAHNPAHRLALFLTACREARLGFRPVRYLAGYPNVDLGYDFQLDSYDSD